MQTQVSRCPGPRIRAPLGTAAPCCSAASRFGSTGSPWPFRLIHLYHEISTLYVSKYPICQVHTYIPNYPPVCSKCSHVPVALCGNVPMARLWPLSVIPGHRGAFRGIPECLWHIQETLTRPRSISGTTRRARARLCNISLGLCALARSFSSSRCISKLCLTLLQICQMSSQICRISSQMSSQMCQMSPQIFPRRMIGSANS